MSKSLRRKFYNKQTNAEKEGLKVLLSYDEYAKLALDAGITAEDIGNKGYHLARYNDKGDYKIGNCRFIYYIENIKEKKLTDKNKRAAIQNITNYNKNRSPEERLRIGKIAGAASVKSHEYKHKNGIKHEHGSFNNKLTSIEIKRRIDLIENSDIDLMKYGWVSKVAIILNVSHTHVKRFVDKNYNKPVFRRR